MHFSIFRFSILRYSLLVAGLFLLTGCGVKKNIPVPEQFWQEKPKVVLAYTKEPVPTMVVSGNQGLLDMAITQIANNKIINCVKRADLSWYRQFPQQFAQQLKQRSIQTVIDPEPIINNKSLKSLLAKAQGNKLLTFELVAIGIRREYSMGIISKCAPQAYCVLAGKLIDPCNPKKPLWCTEIEIMQPVQEPWDQTPNFPNVMCALQQATEAARTELLDSFFSGH